MVNVFAYFNKKMEEYTLPIFDDHDVEKFVDNLKHTLAYAIKVRDDHNVLVNLGDCVLNQIGTYDNETGKFFSIEPIALLDCEVYINGFGKDEN